MRHPNAVHQIGTRPMLSPSNTVWNYTNDITTSWNYSGGKGGNWSQITQITPIPPAVGNTTEEINAPINADGSAPYAEYTSTDESPYYGSFYEPEPWTSLSPQEQGSLEVIAPTPSLWSEQRSGQASWILHVGGLGTVENECDVQLTASATDEVGGANSNNWGIIVSSIDEPGPEINDLGLQLDTNYVAYKVEPVGASVADPIIATSPLSSDTPGATPYYLEHTTACSPPGNTNTSRTTIGIGEVVYLGGMPDSTVWSVSGNGTISPTNGNTTTFTAALSPGTATVTAQTEAAQLQVTFNIEAPNSITVIGINNTPLGTSNPSGTMMGASTIFTNILGPTDVSFYNVHFQENPSPSSINVTFPNGTVQPIYFERDSFVVGCGQNTFTDQITTPEFPTNYLNNGSTFVDFSYGNSWTDQYQDDNGNWVNFYTLTATVKFDGGSKQCQIEYLGTPGSWQGPY